MGKNLPNLQWERAVFMACLLRTELISWAFHGGPTFQCWLAQGGSCCLLCHPGSWHLPPRQAACLQLQQGPLALTGELAFYFFEVFFFWLIFLGTVNQCHFSWRLLFFMVSVKIAKTCFKQVCIYEVVLQFFPRVWGVSKGENTKTLTWNSKVASRAWPPWTSISILIVN